MHHVSIEHKIELVQVKVLSQHQDRAYPKCLLIHWVVSQSKVMCSLSHVHTLHVQWLIDHLNLIKIHYTCINYICNHSTKPSSPVIGNAKA